MTSGAGKNESNIFLYEMGKSFREHDFDKLVERKKKLPKPVRLDLRITMVTTWPEKTICRRPSVASTRQTTVAATTRVRSSCCRPSTSTATTKKTKTNTTRWATITFPVQIGPSPLTSTTTATLQASCSARTMLLPLHSPKSRTRN